ncbi:MAG: prepilin-type N-terminal cleavage/methylation domain-containing protein, partial [Gammaproteobacteria bacterium]|nr:prepilin-type N-terminal cleavage/methylation domain-containing protein [Gammaproteobacteria bacterium]
MQQVVISPLRFDRGGFTLPELLIAAAI